MIENSITEGTRLIVRDIKKEMESAFIDYSMSVITARALPDVRDGLKPVHRRILYTMHERGNDPSHPTKKPLGQLPVFLSRGGGGGAPPPSGGGGGVWGPRNPI